MVIRGICLASLITIFGASGGLAQERSPLMGSIEIEESGPTKASYASTQDKAIEYFSALAARAAKGELSTPLAELDDETIRFMAAVYLYCSINRGTCPIVLDPIFESDLINSVIAGSSACPNMTKFWKYWAANSMDERHSYLVKTGDLMAAQNFRVSVRPRYIRCRQTIDELLPRLRTGAGLDVRYASEEAGRNIQLLPKLLNELKQNGTNVFSSTGTQQSEERPKKN